jgi:hypothetical protein
MGGLGRKPIKTEKPKPRKQSPRPPRVMPEHWDLEEVAFGRRKKEKK